MKKGNSTQYCNLFGYQWLEGSIRVDLDSAGRGVWADLLALASISRRVGYIERSEGIPYSTQELADKFHAPLELVQKTIDICLKEGRLSKDDYGTLLITNWNTYQNIPLGSAQPTKPRYAKKKKLTEKQKNIIRNQDINKNPDKHRDGLKAFFNDTIIENNGEVH